MNNPAIWVLGLLTLGIAFVLLRGHLSRQRRAQRRRQRSHWPVISRRTGPSVKLAVDARTPKRDRKR
jgi:hypothetical protein